MSTRPDRLDAGFHLLDRQLVDVDGRLVGKVDDLELLETDGMVEISAILSGPGALGPRLGGRLGAWVAAVWRRLHPDAEPLPGRVPIEDVCGLDSAVHLRRSRAELDIEGFEGWAEAKIVSRLPLVRRGNAASVPAGPAGPSGPAPAAGRPGNARPRLSDLIGQQVTSQTGIPLGSVSDLRVSVVWDGADEGRHMTRLPALGIVVNHRFAGSLLGYERRHDQGPWLLRRILGALRPKTSGYVRWEEIGEVDWENRGVRHGGERLGEFEL